MVSQMSMPNNVFAYDDYWKDMDRHGLVIQRYNSKQADHDQQSRHWSDGSPVYWHQQRTRLGRTSVNNPNTYTDTVVLIIPHQRSPEEEEVRIAGYSL
jgi:hypothetical protein